jgi:nitrite reductase/ring-hydroxylating ferredoxin subunit/uncharacterized membrane protein
MAGETDTIAAGLQTQQWMAPLEDGLKKGLDAAFAPDSARGKPVENALHGVWLGHPLHPVLTDIPVGAWTVAFVLDLIEEFGGSRKYRTGADAAVTIGMVGACAAAVPGLTDWKEIDQGSRRTGLLHAMLNTAALGLYAYSAVQRNRRNRSSARALAYGAFGVMLGSAWLGGHLSYVNRAGVARVPRQEPPEAFTPVLPETDLADSTPRRVEYKGYPIFLLKRNQEILALTDLCTHAGGPLSEGSVEGDCIRCPWHGSLFSMRTGDVMEGPAVHGVMRLETRVQDGQVEVRAPQSGA